MSLHSSVLKYLDGVARYGSIRRAARKLNVSSSSINRHILTLEAEFGLQLFERVAKGVRLTAAGRILLEHVRRTLKDFDFLNSDIDSLKGLRSGRILIATVASVGTTLLSAIVTDFRQLYPGISFDIVAANSVTVADLVTQDEVDIGFTFDPGQRSHLREFFGIDLNLGAIMAIDHPLAGKRKLSLSACLEHDLILPSPTLSIRDIIDAVLVRRSVQPRICLEVDSMSVIKSMVINGAGISFQTIIGLDPELGNGQLLFKPLIDTDIEEDRFAVIGSSGRELPATSRVFIDHACAMLKDYFANIKVTRFLRHTEK